MTRHFFFAGHKFTLNDMVNQEIIAVLSLKTNPSTRKIVGILNKVGECNTGNESFFRITGINKPLKEEDFIKVIPSVKAANTVLGWKAKLHDGIFYDGTDNPKTLKAIKDMVIRHLNFNNDSEITSLDYFLDKETKIVFVKETYEKGTQFIFGYRSRELFNTYCPKAEEIAPQEMKIKLSYHSRFKSNFARSRITTEDQISTRWKDKEQNSSTEELILSKIKEGIGNYIGEPLTEERISFLKEEITKVLKNSFQEELDISFSFNNGELQTNIKVIPLEENNYSPSTELNLSLFNDFKETKEEKKMANVKASEGFKEAKYQIMAPGSNEKNTTIDVDKLENIIRVEITEKEIEEGIFEISVPRRYDLEETKATIVDGIITLTVPTTAKTIQSVKIN